MNKQMQGVLWMLAATFWFAIMTAMVRYLSAFMHPLQIVFFRNFFALLLMLPWFSRNYYVVIYSKGLDLHLWRALTGVCGMGMWFYALSIMPINDAVALSFSVPLITTILAIVFLGEKIGYHRWTALFCGFIGVMVILRPGFIEFNKAAIFVILTTCTWSVSNILVKKLTLTESSRAIVFYMTFLMTPISLLPALLFWQQPSFTLILWLFALAFVSNMGQISMSNAYRKVDITFLGPIDFMRLVFVSIIAWFAFDEVLDIYTALGAFIIVTSSVYIARRERKAQVLAGQGFS